jgi:hypothetical protein
VSRKPPTTRKRVVELRVMVVTAVPLKALTTATLGVSYEATPAREGSDASVRRDRDVEYLPLISVEARAAEVQVPK